MPSTARSPRLAHWLRHHDCIDSLELQHRERMLELLSLPGDPFSRDSFSPGHFTASGFVLSPQGDALLLIHHRKLDRWLQPGGHVEPTDTDLASAALREVVEETGLADLVPAGDGPFDLDVHDIPALGADPAHAHFDVRFLFRAVSRELVTSDEVRAARFFPLSQLRAQARQADADPSVMRAVRKLEG